MDEKRVKDNVVLCNVDIKKTYDTNTFEKFTDDILTVSVQNRISDKEPVTVENLLNEMNLNCIKHAVAEAGFKLDTVITGQNCSALEDIMFANIETIVKSYNTNKDAAKKFFSSIIKSSKRICIVDVGWRGTTLIQLKSLINEWFPESKDFMSFAGLKGVGSSFATSSHLNNEIFAYLFSDEKTGIFTKCILTAECP